MCEFKAAISVVVIYLLPESSMHSCETRACYLHQSKKKQHLAVRLVLTRNISNLGRTCISVIRGISGSVVWSSRDSERERERASNKLLAITVDAKPAPRP